MQALAKHAVAVGFMTFFVRSGILRAEMMCPDSLAVHQRAEVPAGWSVTLGETPPRLSSVTLYDGQPANRVSLKHTKRQSSGREITLTWILPETSRNIYLQCGYERTAALISSPLPPGTTRCDAVFDRTTTYAGGAAVIKRMVCR